jgi:hypothetical protein
MSFSKARRASSLSTPAERIQRAYLPMSVYGPHGKPACMSAEMETTSAKRSHRPIEAARHHFASDIR